MMTLDEVIASLSLIRDKHGGYMEVCFYDVRYGDYYPVREIDVRYLDEAGDSHLAITENTENFVGIH
jgi:hypothetical protein